MGTHYIPRNVKGEGRFLIIFSMKSLVTTAIGGGIGIIFYYIFKAMGLNVVGIVIFAILALIGYGVGILKIPQITGLKFTKNVVGDSIDEVVLRFIKFKKNKKVYTYIETKEEE